MIVYFWLVLIFVWKVGSNWNIFMLTEIFMEWKVNELNELDWFDIWQIEHKAKRGAVDQHNSDIIWDEIEIKMYILSS